MHNLESQSPRLLMIRQWRASSSSLTWFETYSAVVLISEKSSRSVSAFELRTKLWILAVKLTSFLHPKGNIYRPKRSFQDYPSLKSEHTIYTSKREGKGSSLWPLERSDIKIQASLRETTGSLHKELSLLADKQIRVWYVCINYALWSQIVEIHISSKAKLEYINGELPQHPIQTRRRSTNGEHTIRLWKDVWSTIWSQDWFAILFAFRRQKQISDAIATTYFDDKYTSHGIRTTYFDVIAWNRHLMTKWCWETNTGNFFRFPISFSFRLLGFLISLSKNALDK